MTFTDAIPIIVAVVSLIGVLYNSRQIRSNVQDQQGVFEAQAEKIRMEAIERAQAIFKASNEELCAQVNRCKASNQEFTDKIKELSIRVECLEREKDALEKQVFELETNRQKDLALIQELQGEVDKWKSDYDELLGKVQVLEKENVALKTKRRQGQ